MFQKIMEINLDIVINRTYKLAKFYYEILYIIGFTKITKSDKFCRLKIYIVRSTCLLIFL
jgi:hypothetical protein